MEKRQKFTMLTMASMATLFTVGIYILFFTEVKNLEEPIANIMVIVMSVVLVVTINDSGKWIYKDFKVSKLQMRILEFFGLLKAASYIIIAQLLVAIFSHDPWWWILSVCLGVIALAFEQWVLSFHEGNR